MAILESKDKKENWKGKINIISLDIADERN